MHFTFGKYKGQEIEEIYNRDRGYLIWITLNNNTAGTRIDREVKHIEALVAEDIKHHKAREAVLKTQRQAAYAPIVGIFGGASVKKALQRGTEISRWSQSIIDSLRAGDRLSARAQEIITDLCGKSSGRRNSKAYKSTFETVNNAFQLANTIDQNN